MYTVTTTEQTIQKQTLDACYVACVWMSGDIVLTLPDNTEHTFADYAEFETYCEENA